VADSYDNALGERENGLFKTECIYGPDATGWDDVRASRESVSRFLCEWVGLWLVG
jgi:transposase InsO family protein